MPDAAAAPPVDDVFAVQAPAAEAARRAGGAVQNGADYFAMLPQIALMLAMYNPPPFPSQRSARECR